ncbi:MAG: selenide, water dikinase SelD [Acetobacteraceae bacterium]|nr:selenide, water dikinase SelD [Acetobacteraceae bacterium]
MTPPLPISTDIVLLGAGHAHVEVLRRAAMAPMPGVRLTLVAREGHTPYSGMLPGLIRGEHGFDDAHLDCARLAAAAGARLILAEASGIDLARRAVALAGRPALPYDLLSVNVGGVPAMPAGGGVGVKPIGRFLGRLAAIETGLAPGVVIAVVGNGAAGCELALALAQRLAGRAAIVLVGRSAAPMAGTPALVRRAVQAALVASGVAMHGGVDAGGHDGRHLALSDGRMVAADHVLWATGVVAPDFLAASGLACDAAGCIRVDATLRSLGDPRVFAAGDCAALEGAPRPKAGVWAVRAGGPLAGNLAAAAAGRTLRPWRPQRDALAIVGLGHGRAVAFRGRWAFAGRLAARWKTRIDRRWMAMYQELRPMAAGDAMRCGGCGAKIGPDALAAALAGLAEAPRPDIPVGMADGDDAAVTLPPPGMAVVQSVDHFRGFIDDPYIFGRIAAAHALSDIHAMGARPWTAMAIAALPYMPGRRMGQDLRAMMLGASDVLRGDGCVLVGGHSAEGAEAALGFAVTGLATPGALWRKSGLRVGDALVLTKPLGTGIVLAAHMQGLARVDWLAACLDSMATSNAAAAEVLRGFGVVACTDVTGFGLGGHLMEMLRASGMAAVLDEAALPALPGAMELAARGVASTLAPANLAGLDMGDGPALALLADPQTSGGLLAGVAAARAAACVAALREVGCAASVVGQVVQEGRPSFSEEKEAKRLFFIFSGG